METSGDPSTITSQIDTQPHGVADRRPRCWRPSACGRWSASCSQSRSRTSPASLGRVPALHWLGAVGGAALAYAALAGYDRIALIHLGKKISWPFIAIASFVAYALSHNIGAALISGAVVRYRDYSTKGLSAAEVGVLVALCAFTFVLGVVILGGILLCHRAPPRAALRAHSGMAGACRRHRDAARRDRATGSARSCTSSRWSSGASRSSIRSRRSCSASSSSARWNSSARRRSSISACRSRATPATSSCSASSSPRSRWRSSRMRRAASACWSSSSSPGFTDVPPADVLAALIVFRLFYLVIPLAISFVVVLLFERQQTDGEPAGRRLQAHPPARRSRSLRSRCRSRRGRRSGARGWR